MMSTPKATSTAPRASLPSVAEADQRHAELGVEFAERIAALEAERRDTEATLAAAADVPSALVLIDRREHLGRQLEATRCVKRVLVARADAARTRAHGIAAARAKIAEIEEALPRAREADKREGTARPTPSHEERMLATIASVRERLAEYEAE